MCKLLKFRNILVVFAIIFAVFSLTACSEKQVDTALNELENLIDKELSNIAEVEDGKDGVTAKDEDENKESKESKESNESNENTDSENNKDNINKPEKNEYYYDVESVVLYLHYYGKLPKNFVTKNKARDEGWNGGSVEDYIDGAAIGGDKFGNREGLLPKKSGRTYTECDIDTDGKDSRGAKRLVFSNDGLYFYTDDHYSSFTELKVEEGKVKWN